MPHHIVEIFLFPLGKSRVKAGIHIEQYNKHLNLKL